VHKWAIETSLRFISTLHSPHTDCAYREDVTGYIKFIPLGRNRFPLLPSVKLSDVSFPCPPLNNSL
jgi:hypothetical protein